MLAEISSSMEESEKDNTIESHEDDLSGKKSSDAQSPLIAHIQWLVKTKKYEIFILSTIVLNTIALSCDPLLQLVGGDNILLNYEGCTVCGGTLTIEATKVIGVGVTAFNSALTQSRTVRLFRTNCHQKSKTAMHNGH